MTTDSMGPQGHRKVSDGAIAFVKVVAYISRHYSLYNSVNDLKWIPEVGYRLRVEHKDRMRRDLLSQMTTTCIGMRSLRYVFDNRYT